MTLRRDILAWTVMAAILVVLGVQLHRSIQWLRAGRLLRRVEVITLQEATAGKVSPSLTAANLRQLREAGALDPLLVGVPIARGSQYLLLSRPDDAVAAYEEALELEVRPEIHLNLGRAHLMAGREDEALEAFVLAVRLAPQLRREVPETLRKKVIRRSGIQG